MARRSAPLLFPHHAGYSPAWRGRPPHMTPAETQLLYWYLDNNQTGIEELWFDVAMDGIPGVDGALVSSSTGTRGKFQRMWQRLTSKRADAIARAGSTYRVLEMRREAKPQTLGELHQYNQLSRDEWPDLHWQMPLLICQRIDYAIIGSMNAQGLTFIVAPENLDLPTARGFKTLHSVK